MPGTVIRVLVEPGATVAARQPLVVLEAMKMETPLVSPYEATVRAVHVGEGDRVAGGAVLVELDGVNVARFADAGAFLAEAEPLLLADEARHNLILGHRRDDPRRARPLPRARSVARARRGDGLVAAALRTPPYNLIRARRSRTRRSPHSPRVPRRRDAEPSTLAAGSASDACSIARRACPSVGASPSAACGARRRDRRGRSHSASAARARRTTASRLRWWIAGDEVRRSRTRARPAGGRRPPARRADAIAWTVDGSRSPTAGILRSGRTAASPVPRRPGAARRRTASASARSTRRRTLRGRGYATALPPSASQRLLDGRLFEAAAASASSTPTSPTRPRTRSTSGSATAPRRRVGRDRQLVATAQLGKSFWSFIAAPMSPLSLSLPVM